MTEPSQFTIGAQARCSDGVCGEVTRVVVAHRLSTLEHADRIFVIDAGRLVETGTFDELIDRDGLFGRLARRQTL